MPVINDIWYPDEPPGLGEAIAKELMATAYCFDRRGPPEHRLIFKSFNLGNLEVYEGRFGCLSVFTVGHQLSQKKLNFRGANISWDMESSWRAVLALHRLDGTVVWQVPDYEKQVVKLALLSI